jgi:hypothetical protein
MVPSPLAPLIDWLQANQVFGWLSIGATLLEGSSDAQRQVAAYPVELIRAPSLEGKPRSVAIPWGVNEEESWLLVWMTRPQAMSLETVVKRAHSYMIAKKHQLGLRRGASFVYDESTGIPCGASYDSGQTQVDPAILDEIVSSLRPPDDIETRAQITQRRRAAERAAKRKNKRR